MRDTVMGTLQGILPAELRDGVRVAEEDLDAEEDGSVFKNKLSILQANLTESKLVQEFINNLFNKLSSEDLSHLENEIENRVDDECNFYLRLSKADLLSGAFALGSQDAVQVRMMIASYPKKKENAVKILKEYFTDVKSKMKK